MFLPIISSCSNLAGCQWVKKLCGYSMKMREGIECDNMHHYMLTSLVWDLTGSEMFVALIALIIICNVSLVGFY